jgi:hypothetical protein
MKPLPVLTRILLAVALLIAGAMLYCRSLFALG